MKFEVGAKLMSMKGYATIIPYGGVEVWGELGIGFQQEHRPRVLDARLFRI
jgi:hypothetical protein